MLNIKGAFVILTADGPVPVLIGESTLSLYRDRCEVVGFDKAARATFGSAALYALPCTAECMETIALNYQGPHEAAVRGMCARIALRQPIGGDAGPGGGDGGLKVAADDSKPRPKRGPGGAAVKAHAPAEVRP